MSLALCVGVAFLLLAGSAFAQTIGTTSILAADVPSYATQAAKTNQLYTIPAAVVGPPAHNYGNISRAMGVLRTANVAGGFFVTVTLPSGFVFNATPAINITVAATPASGAVLPAPTIFAGGYAAGPPIVAYNYVSFLCQFTTAPTVAPTLVISTAGWQVKDTNTGGSLGTVGNNATITVRTYDALGGIEFDNGGGSVATATWLTAKRGITASITPTKAAIDTATLRKTFVVGGFGGFDTASQDNDATLTVTYPADVYTHTGNLFTLVAADQVNLTISSPDALNLNGVGFFTFAPGATPPQVQNAATLTAAQQASNSYTLVSAPNTPIPGNNAAFPANGGTSVIPLRLTNDGSTLTPRTINIVMAINIGGGATGAVTTTIPATTLSVWGYNGAILLANWANANVPTNKSRFYIFNESAISNATIYARVLSIPVITNTTPGAQIGNTIQFTQTLAAGQGMTIRMEDIINATGSGMTATNLAGPDGSFNVAVEITILAPQASGFQTQNITGYTQTFNQNATMTFGLTPMSRVQ